MAASLLLVQGLTRLRRLEAVRLDFISNRSHELRTPLALLKALTKPCASERERISSLAAIRPERDLACTWRKV